MEIETEPMTTATQHVADVIVNAAPESIAAPAVSTPARRSAVRPCSVRPR